MPWASGPSASARSSQHWSRKHGRTSPPEESGIYGSRPLPFLRRGGPGDSRLGRVSLCLPLTRSFAHCTPVGRDEVLHLARGPDREPQLLGRNGGQWLSVPSGDAERAAE